MATITSEQLLAKVKSGMGIATDFQDDTLKIYIDEVKAFMIDAGVDPAVVNDEQAVGCVLRGVIDLWNYGSGTAGFSDYFKQRVIQLCSAVPPAVEGGGA